MADQNDWNRSIIEEFRTHAGRVGGPFEGQPLLLLHTVGARSGAEHVTPVMYRTVGDEYAVFASKAGAPTNPDWYHNLVAHPDVTIELGDRSLRVRARVAEEAEREGIWEAQKREFPNFAEYEQKTSRVIPVVLLSPAPN